MKTPILALLFCAIVAGCLSLLERRNVWSDYNHMLNYAVGVEEKGFQQKEFEEFALDCRRMRKDVSINAGFAERLTGFSVIFSGGAICLIIFKWPKKKD